MLPWTAVCTARRRGRGRSHPCTRSPPSGPRAGRAVPGSTRNGVRPRPPGCFTRFLCEAPRGLRLAGCRGTVGRADSDDPTCSMLTAGVPPPAPGCGPARGAVVPRRTPSRLGAHAAPRLTQALPAAALPEGPQAQGTGADRAARAPGRAPLPIPSEQAHRFSNSSDTPARHDGLLRLLFGLAVAVTGHSALQPAPGGLAASPLPYAPQRSEALRTRGTGLAPAVRVRPSQQQATVVRLPPLAPKVQMDYA